VLLNAAGTRPGGRDTFLLRGKKVSKESRPAFPARRSRAPLPTQVPGGRLRKLACGSNSEAALPRPCLAPLGGAEGRRSGRTAMTILNLNNKAWLMPRFVIGLEGYLSLEPFLSINATHI